MKHLPQLFLAILIGIFALQPAEARAATAAEVDAAARAALKELYSINPKAASLGKQAAAILVFPSITKGGFLVAGQHGNGALITKKGTTAGYYNSVAASFGIEAGIQKFAYALFFMNENALKYLDKQGGWDLGTAPNLVIVDKGGAKDFGTKDVKKEIYAFFFSQKGLMGGISLQGSKISKVTLK